MIAPKFLAFPFDRASGRSRHRNPLPICTETLPSLSEAFPFRRLRGSACEPPPLASVFNPKTRANLDISPSSVGRREPEPTSAKRSLPARQDSTNGGWADGTELCTQPNTSTFRERR
ncbi:hypothetical protein RJT34_31033 [Clitoria ternatea]|uniref:Uncharacterized protein n=1 Tax=Clitoria ternatea TaxID=43366 RepID=A0AAN9EUK9_CLITE